MAKTKTKEEIIPDSAVLYVDGSSQPNPGLGGWGIHGYLYVDTDPKKGSGNADHYVTDMGYVKKAWLDGLKSNMDESVLLDKVFTEPLKGSSINILLSQYDCKQVTPIEYLDGFGPMGYWTDCRSHLVTNNAAEIMAFTNALRFCKDRNIKKIRIYADSEYTLDGWNKALDIWANNNWMRRDGTEIKNKGLWRDLYELKLQMKDCEVDAQWVAGHSVFLGNNLADTNAAIGRSASEALIEDDSFIVSPAQGYWKPEEVDRHPLICHQKLFFNSDSQYHNPGIYHLGAIDKDLGLMGKKLSDTSYSVVCLKEPIRSMEDLIEYHCTKSNNEEATVVANLLHFFKADTYRQFTEYGKYTLRQPFPWNSNLVGINKLPVTEVVDPPKKCMNAIMAVNNLHTWMNDWLLKRPGHQRFTVTDLTEVFYETTTVVKKKKEVSVTKLRTDIKAGQNSIEVDANFKTHEEVEMTLPTILSFGIDCPDRLGLKRIEHLNPKVTLISWQEGVGVFRYFTIFEVGEDTAAYCGYYSNVRLARNKVKK